MKNLFILSVILVFSTSIFSQNFKFSLNQELPKLNFSSSGISSQSINENFKLSGDCGITLSNYKANTSFFSTSDGIIVNEPNKIRTRLYTENSTIESLNYLNSSLDQTYGRRGANIGKEVGNFSLEPFLVQQ